VNTAFLVIGQIPVSFNNTAVPLKDIPSVGYMNTNRSKSITLFISRPRVNAPSSFALSCHPSGITGSNRSKLIISSFILSV
jgi:hypothetical protein